METTRQFLLDHCARYPALRPQDLLKALHQSVFGCGHFVTDEERGMALLRQELAAELLRGDLEPLDGAYCRLHLGYAEQLGLAAETLFRLFQLSAEQPAGDAVALEARLTELLQLAQEGLLPFSAGDVENAGKEWRGQGFPACRSMRRRRRTR